MYKKILVPLDGSEFSRKALDHAEKLAKIFDSELLLLQVVPFMPIYGSPELVTPLIVDEKQKELAQKYLFNLAEELRKKEPSLKTVYWTIDDPHFLLKANPPWLGEFEYVLTSCEESREEYERRGQKAFTFWPAVDPWRHRHRFDAALECNFVLAMTNCYAKDEFPDLVFDRRDLARALQAKFGGVHLYGKWDGYGWGSEKGCPELKECYKGWRTHAELVPVFSSARISVNAHGYTKHKGYLNERNFEILGSGGFLLVDRVAGIGEIFQEGCHCVFYDSLDDLLEKAAWYLEHEGERKRIAYEGMVYAHANFNALDWVRRFDALIAGDSGRF